MPQGVQSHFHRLLSVSNEGVVPRARAQAEADRLWARVQRLLAMELISPEADRASLQLACIALQLPARSARPASPGRANSLPLRERVEQAAELLITVVGEADEELCTRTTKVLRELTVRSPELEEARLLSDALNLDDFGVSGLFVQAMTLGRQNGAIAAIAEGSEKRDQYGYWDARLKDGFHFEPVRQIARRRLETAQQAARMLAAELREDGLMA